jgi:hypothetical protein
MMLKASNSMDSTTMKKMKMLFSVKPERKQST